MSMSVSEKYIFSSGVIKTKRLFRGFEDFVRSRSEKSQGYWQGLYGRQ